MKTKLITEKQFQAYENVRTSGITNMWDVKKVAYLSGDHLSIEETKYVMSNYSDLRKQYPNVRKS